MRNKVKPFQNNDLVTLKEAAKLAGVSTGLVHSWMKSNRAAGIHVGQGGYPLSTGVGGRVTYHNLVSIKDCLRLSKVYHTKKKPERASQGRLSLDTHTFTKKFQPRFRVVH